MSRAAPEIESRIIRAGAGAGKTTRLISEVEALAESFYRKHDRWPRLVLTTFTIKATQELRERLFLRSTQSQNPEKEHSLTEFVLSNQSLMITTIHGVLSQYFRSGAEAMGWDPNFRFIDDAEDLRNAKTLLAELVFGAASIDAEILEEVRFQSLLSTLLKYARQEWIHDSFAPATLQDFENEANRLRKELLLWSETFLKEASDCSLTEGWASTTESIREIRDLVAQPSLSWREV
ncbi:MAG: UvrD-helicase domain-containing protein, partial [Bdellovibrionales bacterium]|nr:UvrD-helicase domain-containing protein [Bdellovibrionales bacterium]